MTAITSTAWLLVAVATIVFATITLCLLSMARGTDAERIPPESPLQGPVVCRRPAGTGGRQPVRTPSVTSRSTRIPVKR